MARQTERRSSSDISGICDQFIAALQHDLHSLDWAIAEGLAMLRKFVYSASTLYRGNFGTERALRNSAT
jgi:hypothetical protein